MTSAQPLDFAPRSLAGGSDGSRSAAHIATVNVSASTTYAQEMSARAMMTPATSGPATVAALDMVKFSVLAWAISAAGTIREMIAERVGMLTATAADCNATSTSSSTGLSTRRNDWTASPS